MYNCIVRVNIYVLLPALLLYLHNYYYTQKKTGLLKMKKLSLISVILIFVLVFVVSGCSANHPKNLCNTPAKDTYNMYFAFNSPSLDYKSADIAKQLAQFASCCGKKIELEGYTDIKGPADYNLRLGQHRVDAVKDLLISLGVPAENITVVSYGYADPVALGDSEEGNALNRRVVAVLN